MNDTMTAMKDAKKMETLPPLLQEISDPPKQLYSRGKIPDWKGSHFLTVVGSRRYSEYGRSVCHKLISELSGYPVIIVSGLALGTDALAHKEALEAGLTTIAFPGSGLDDSVIAPRSNFNLAMDILKSGGALFSEYEPKQKAALWTFPRRNRLMAGISHAVLVIEAAEKSGTLITSRLATEYNRDVMAVPGSIFREQAAGPHMLLKLGAYPVTSGKDVLEHFGISLEKDISGDTGSSDLIEKLGPVEKGIWGILGEPRNKQYLLENLEFSITEINIALSSLEIRGLVTESGGKVRRA